MKKIFFDFLRFFQILDFLNYLKEKQTKIPDVQPLFGHFSDFSRTNSLQNCLNLGLFLILWIKKSELHFPHRLKYLQKFSVCMCSICLNNAEQLAILNIPNRKRSLSARFNYHIQIYDKYVFTYPSAITRRILKHITKCVHNTYDTHVGRNLTESPNKSISFLWVW